MLRGSSRLLDPLAPQGSDRRRRSQALGGSSSYPFFRVFILALEGVHFGNPIAVDSPWKKGYDPAAPATLRDFLILSCEAS